MKEVSTGGGAGKSVLSSLSIGGLGAGGGPCEAAGGGGTTSAGARGAVVLSITAR